MTLLLSLSACTLLAGSEQIHFKRLSVEDGLSQNTVLALTQDHHDNIWMGTMDGLNRYDGYRWQTFYKDPEDGHSLANNHVLSLCTDRSGAVWVGTQVGLSCYDLVKNHFVNYSLPGNLPMQVFSIADLGEENRLLLASNVGLVTFEKKSGAMTVVPHLQDITIYSICRVNDGVLLGTSAGVYFYYIRNGKVERLLPALQKEIISDIIYDPKTQFCWLASLGNGLYGMDDKFQIRKHYSRREGARQLTTAAVRKLKLDDRGNIWIGTIDALFVFDPVAETFDKCSFSYEDPSSLGHNSVRSFLKDNQGGMWIGTFHGGVNYYHPLAPAFGTWKHSVYHNSLSDNTVSCITEDPKEGNLWIGTNDGGLNYYDRKQHLFSCFRAQGNDTHSLRSNNIKCVFAATDGGVYVGTHGGGLSRIEAGTKRVENYAIPQTVSVANSCYALLDGGDGTLWVGAMTGLYQFDQRTRQLTLHPLARHYPKLNKTLIPMLYRDSKGRVWIGTEESLFLYTPGDGVVELSDRSPVRPAALIQSWWILEDSRANIWIASSLGLYRYKEQDASFDYYSTKSGLPNNFVYGLLEDEQGRLWLTTNKGLSCFDVAAHSFRNYTQQDGLSHNQFTHYGLCKTRDGMFFLGTLGGVTYFNPLGFVDNPFAPEAVITEATVQNRPVAQSKDDRIQYIQDETGKLLGMSFPSNQKLFNIRFSVVNYLAGQRNQFAYKLDGFDEEWVYTSQYTSQRGAGYSNLPPGEYLFQVKACNNDGKWCAAPTTFRVQITPMWYQTWWFKALVSLLILGLIGLAAYILIARARLKMQMQIEHIEKEKAEEVGQEKIRFYTNMSHELRTPLSLILGPVEELLGPGRISEKNMRQKLSYVYRNAQKLLYIINQLLDFRKAESGTMPLQVSVANVEAWAMETFLLFADTARKRNIDYDFQSELNGCLLPVDRRYLEMILQNLLSNAFKFTADGGRIELRLWKREECFGFKVQDNGAGIAAEKLERVFECFYQTDEHRTGGTGVGLSLVKCLVEKHHGTVTVASEAGQCTEFDVSLPVDPGVFSQEERASEEEGEVRGDTLLPPPEELVTEESEACEPGAEPDSTEKNTILLVDDNKEMLNYLNSHFRTKYSVLTAGSGDEAWEVMKKQKVDIVLSDVMMPGTDGIKLCELIKRNLHTCHIPVILLSAKGSVEAQSAGISIGADDYIPKPFSISLLMGKINNILRTKQRLIHYYSNTIDIDTAKMTSNVLDEEFIGKAIQAVEEHIDNEGFSADDLAELLCVSRSTLYLKMNSVSGEPPANFIRRIRFNKACKLLLEERYSISEISGMTGFGSPSYFSSSFKKYIGCLPSEYVRSQKGGV